VIVNKNHQNFLKFIMKKVFKFIGYALLSIIGLIAILLTGVYIKSYSTYKEAAKLIGKEAPGFYYQKNDILKTRHSFRNSLI